MDRRVKDILKYILWIAVAVLLLYFCFRRVDWKNFGAALAQCRWEFVILSMLLGALTFYLRGLRWQMLLRPIDPSTSSLTCFNAMNICMVVNLLLPRVGEVVRAGYVTKNSAKGPDGKRLAGIEKVLANPGEKDDILELTRNYLENKLSLDSMTDEWGALLEKLEM